MSMTFNSEEFTLLRALAVRFPTVDTALAELSALRAGLCLPKGAVHVVSDVHGEYKKLRHIINNASGTLRPLVESLFANRLTEEELRDLLAVLYYPREAMEYVTARLRDVATRQAWVRRTLRLQFEIVRQLTGNYRHRHVVSLFPQAYEELFEELLHEPCNSRGPEYVDAMIDGLVAEGRDIATAVRISLRYRRLSQLEEGYGLIMSPLEKLARTVYADDPAERFKTRGTGLRDDLLMAQMQKAAAIIQFKLEGQLSRRHPEWEMEHRNLLHRIDHAAGTVEIEGKVHQLRDTHFPTIDPAVPYELCAEERACMDRLKQSFISSARLWEHMSYVTRRGAMWLRRDHAVIFHGCLPVSDDGDFLSLTVDGAEYSGRALFDALGSVVRRAFREGEAAGGDADWLWYLWTGPRSPLFGKDRMAAFENYFIDDKEARREHKNRYFALLNDRDFCQRVASEFGVMENGLIVNGHVPVKVEKGEEPLKRSGSAVTIDGAFSEAYGDRGYTLILAPERIALAEHHHFESISEAITSGADIVPKVSNLRVYDPPRTIADTEEGEALRQDIGALERLVLAYQEGALLERSDALL